uniref:KRAB domain-containing protein n=1 Tax=Laticauda laticaudata TaxID=8630 RepID=A0A8C5SY03_LATLA
DGAEGLTNPQLQDVVSFEDVAVYFSKEEWSQLDADQKALHGHVMVEYFRNLASLGKNSVGQTSVPYSCSFPYINNAVTWVELRETGPK